jgi:ribosomal protein S18 acetylase RimI-like enzyme
MRDDIEITTATTITDELIEATQRLIPQLSSSAAVPSAEQLREIVASPCTTLLLARDRSQQGRIVGCLTVAVFRIPTGVRAWVEDVIVDSALRGRGVGEALSREAVRTARSRGAQTVELTSRPSRETANRLYQRLGFQLRDTNVYRYSVSADDTG